MRSQSLECELDRINRTLERLTAQIEALQDDNRRLWKELDRLTKAPTITDRLMDHERADSTYFGPG